MDFTELIATHLQDNVENLALHRSQYKNLSDEDWQFFLQQVEGYSRTKEKLPLFAHRLEDGCRTRHAYSLEARGEGWWYPPRISCEQCSSEATARYKAELCDAQCTMHNAQLIDLTGGAGVDTYFMSEEFDRVDYVEQNEELCRLAEHNLPEKVSVHNCSAEEWLEEVESQKSKVESQKSKVESQKSKVESQKSKVESQKSKVERCQTTIFIDPARRDKNGGKVFKLKDCTPNVVELLPRMREVADTILIKLSPMLDISQALRELGGEWDVHVVAVKNEVKEVLLVQNAECTMHNVTCVDLAEGWKFEFTREEEEQAISQLANYELAKGYIYEPCAAILKAGAYKLVGARFGLEKLGVNTHLYVSERLVENFPGRCWKISGVHNAQCTMHNKKANVLTRNYPLSAEQLKKKLKVKDGGEQYIIGTRVGEKPVVLVAERV